MLIVDIEPMGKPRLTKRDSWRNDDGTFKRASVQRWYDFKDKLRAKLPGYVLTPVLFIDFYLPMPQSWSLKKRARMIAEPHQQKPDIDNLVKGFMDATATDDTHVYEIHAQKLWAEKGRIVIIEPDKEK